jgi:hypothetical protein
LGRAEAGEAELAESGEFVRAATREFAGGEDRASELAGQLFNACGTVDGRANAGEIEPVAAADIAQGPVGSGRKVQGAERPVDRYRPFSFQEAFSQGHGRA